MLFVQACTPPVPASNAGPGFNDYANYELERARREVAVTGSGATFVAPQAQTQAQATFAPTPVQTNAIGAADLAAAGIGAQAAVGAPLSAMSPQAQIGVAASTQARADANVMPDRVQAMPELRNNAGISDEQDFDAVSARVSMETDAERRAAQAAVREQVQPTAVPIRPANTGPNIVEYALNAPNAKGREWYSRSLFSGQGRFERNCLKYASADAAQRDFLANGGPERDRKGIDPDGDGFACGWDPAPFLSVSGR
tara:strand:- start:715 stop:1479 length:765 start_codon:yes stop_codon:yes gene_type:complete